MQLTTYQSYHLLAKDLTGALSRTASVAANAREIAYWKAHIGKVTTAEGLIADTRLFTFAMRAYGLGDMAYARGLMRTVLAGGVASSTSFANTLTDTRYRIFAAAFDFKGKGSAVTRATSVGSGTVDRYVRQSLEDTQGTSDEGVRLALYFQRKAGSITSGLDVLADKSLLKVVQTALSIPAETASAPIDAQAVAIEKKLDIAGLKTPAKLDAFLQRFATLYDLSDDQSTTTSTGLLFGGGAVQGLSADTLLTLSKLRTGG